MRLRVQLLDQSFCLLRCQSIIGQSSRLRAALSLVQVLCPSTFYSIEDSTVTSLAPSVTNCPKRSLAGLEPTTPDRDNFSIFLLTSMSELCSINYHVYSQNKYCFSYYRSRYIPPPLCTHCYEVSWKIDKSRDVRYQCLP